MVENTKGTVIDLRNSCADITQIIKEGYNVILMDHEDYVYRPDMVRVQIPEKETFYLSWFTKESYR